MFKNDFLKVEVVSPKIIPGNPQFNAKSVIEILNKSKASLLLFPELTLSGYSAGDLFYQPEFLNECLDALSLVLKESTFTGFYTLGLPLFYNGLLLNIAVAIFNQEIIGVVPKYHLPNANEYNEKRWFDSGFKLNSKTINILGKNVSFGTQIFSDFKHNIHIGIEICEDLWSLETPSDYLVVNGANIILNLSSSSEYVGKNESRRSLIKAHSLKQKSLYLYATTGPFESVGDVVFSNYKAICLNGNFILESDGLTNNTNSLISDIYIPSLTFYRNFAKLDVYRHEDITHVNVNFKVTDEYQFDQVYDKKPFVVDGKDFSFAANIQKVGLAQKLSSLPKGSTKIILGLSGGLDSTLALLASVEAVDYLNIDRSNIICVFMPYKHTSNRAYEDASKLAEALKTTFMTIDITKQVDDHLQLIDHQIKDNTYENVQARIRTLTLMNLANKLGGFVLGTGDLSEIALGFMTYNGDQMSMFSVNSGIPKTYAQKLVKYHSQTNFLKQASLLDSIINAPISPELNENQFTENEVGKYEYNDFIMYYQLMHGFDQKALKLLLSHVFKLESSLASNYVTNYMKRFNASQFKRQTLPEGPKVFKISLNPRSGYKVASDIRRK